MTAETTTHTLTVFQVGNLNLKNRQELKDHAAHEIEKRPRRLVIDLKECPDIDSSGYGVLVSLQRKAKETGVEFVLANPSQEIRDVIRTNKLDTLFTIAP